MTIIKKIILTGALLAFAFGKTAFSEEAKETAATEDRVDLQDQSNPDKPGKAYFAATVINAPMAKVCSTIQDYAAYPSYMPNIAKTTANRLADESSVVDLTLSLPMGKVVQYRLRMTPKVSEKSCQLAWKLVPWEGLKPEDTIVDTVGHWDLSPTADNPSKTLVKYHVYSIPGPIPAAVRGIVENMRKNSIPKMLEALRERVRK